MTQEREPLYQGLTSCQSVRRRLQLVFKATIQHSRNLASFALLYKSIMLLLRQMPRDGATIKEGSYDAFLAGTIGGYAIFGRGIQSSVNQQIVIYVFARVVLGLAKLAVSDGSILPLSARQPIAARAWPVFAALSWGAVMWLYRWYPHCLQPSLRSSMKYM